MARGVLRAPSSARVLFAYACTCAGDPPPLARTPTVRDPERAGASALSFPTFHHVRIVLAATPQAVYILVFQCGYPNPVTVVYLVYIISLLILFLQFYKVRTKRSCTARVHCAAIESHRRKALYVIAHAVLNAR